MLEALFNHHAPLCQDERWLWLEVFTHPGLSEIFILHQSKNGPLLPSCHPSPSCDTSMARKPVTPNNCHILMCSVRGISASLSPTIGEEIEVTGLTGSRLVSQQEGPMQLLRPQRTEGTQQLGHLGRLLPPTSWVWL